MEVVVREIETAAEAILKILAKRIHKHEAEKAPEELDMDDDRGSERRKNQIQY